MDLCRPAALLAVVATTFVLAGCSSDSDPDSADAAHTTSCRTYDLDVAAQDRRAVALLTRAARTSTWDNDVVNTSLNAVSQAAKDAGLVEGLSEDDFKTYSALVDATGSAYARANPSGGLGIDTKTATDFAAAAEAVRSACAST